MAILFPLEEKMTGVPWSEEETAVLIIFSMWGFRQEVIAEILTNRTPEFRGLLPSVPIYKRTMSSVRNKVNDVRSHNPGLWERDEGWNRIAVAEHLHKSTVDHDHVTRLLNLTWVDIERVIRVCFHALCVLWILSHFSFQRNPFFLKPDIVVIKADSFVRWFLSFPFYFLFNRNNNPLHPTRGQWHALGGWRTVGNSLVISAFYPPPFFSFASDSTLYLYLHWLILPHL